MCVVVICVRRYKLYIWHRGLKEQLQGYKRCHEALEDAKTKRHASFDMLNVLVSMRTTLASAMAEVDASIHGVHVYKTGCDEWITRYKHSLHPLQTFFPGECCNTCTH